eukprot:m.310333 g.310333  ORF g.310333 m.310333 type:complete len:567 (+) comp50976_c0_seq1:35-1735(+)
MYVSYISYYIYVGIESRESSHTGKPSALTVKSKELAHLKMSKEKDPLVVNVVTEPEPEPESNGSLGEAPSNVQYKTYSSRWLILAILVLLNISNAMNWIAFAPVTNKAMSYYSVGEFPINCLSLVFFIISIPFGFFGAWLLDTYGLKLGLWIGAWLNAVGAVVRYLSCFNHSYAIVLVGQMICAIAQPFILFAPTKLASFWFSEDQRALATMLSTMANPLGVGIANLASPAIVGTNSTRLDNSSFERMMWIYAVPSCLGALLTTAFVWKSRPPTPPSYSAGEGSQNDFWAGLKKVYKCKQFLILMLSWSIGVGLFNALQTFLEQLLCNQGYTDTFSGLCGALLIFCGIPGAFIAAVFIDKTHRFAETLKVVFLLAVACQFWFVGVLPLEKEKALIASSLSVFGLFALALMPVWLELGVECTYPVLSEATSSGLLWIAGQVMGVIFVGLGSIPGLTNQVPASKSSQCHLGNSTGTSNGSSYAYLGNYGDHTPFNVMHPPTAPVTHPQNVPDMTNFMWATCGISSAVAFILVFFFWPKYGRLEAERAAKRGDQERQRLGSPDGMVTTN